MRSLGSARPEGREESLPHRAGERQARSGEGREEEQQHRGGKEVCLQCSSLWKTPGPLG